MIPFSYNIDTHDIEISHMLRADIMTECKQDQNLASCNCTYEPCARKGMCCDCISYHLKSRELPACVFPDDVEKIYDRSFELFARLVGEGRI